MNTSTQAAPLLGVSASASGYAWKLRQADERSVLTISQRYGIPEMLARVIVGRGVGIDEVDAYLTPTLKALLPDPFHLKDMRVAAERVAQAIMQREKIAIFGDYDVDGATSSALLIRYFRAFGLEPLVHIPDRMKEGYGPNTPALLGLRAAGASLVITVDCGTASHAPLEAAHEAGLDVVVIDHHIGDAALPKAVAVVNPNRMDEESPHRHMAAVGVTFLLVVATNKLLRDAGFFTKHPQPNPMDWLDLVALGTVCDVVSLSGVNRAFVAQGLKILAQRNNAGLAALSDVARQDETPSAYHCGFLLGPRINAGGRVGQAGLGAKILALDDYALAMPIAQKLDQYNTERKTLEAVALDEAMAQAERRVEKDAVVMVEGPWHAGVIGIVAGRIKDKFHKPVAVIAFEGDTGKASARSVSGVDFGSAVVAARVAGLLQAGGGHAMAAGFTIARERLEEFRTFMNERLGAGVQRYSETKALTLDGVISAQAATPELVEQLLQAEPFGMGNPTPKFAFANLQVVKLDAIGADASHLRAILTDAGVGGRASGGKLNAVAFRAVGTAMESVLVQAFKTRANIHVAGQLKLNHWQGTTRVDLHVEDVALA